MNSVQVAAALRILANAIEAPEADATPGTSATQEPAASPKRGRGRPVKGEETAPSAAAQASSTTPQTPASAQPQPDPFETTPVAPPATIEQVREALKGLAAVTSQAIALELLKSVGGAANLTDLKAEKYGLVVQAATAAIGPKTVLVVESDPFAMPPGATPALTVDDVRAVVIATAKHASQDMISKVVMSFGGKAKNPETGVEGPSWKALPPENYAKTIEALNALPKTK
jgi:hypothetical protein